MNHFPVISITRNKNIFEALAGIKLVSILHGHLLLTSSASVGSNSSAVPQLDRMNPKNLHIARESLLQALASLTSDITLELHINTTPNLSLRARSRLAINLFLRTCAESEEEAKESLIRNYLVLMPLLAAHATEAEFSPIGTLEELVAGGDSTTFSQAQSIERRKETLTLIAPNKRAAIGFGVHRHDAPEPDMAVQHVFPWQPSPEDWSALIMTMLSQMEPVKIIVRLRSIPVQDEFFIRLRETIQTCDAFLKWKGADNSDCLSLQAQQLRNESMRQLGRFTEGCFTLGVFLLYHTPALSALSHIIGKAVTGLYSGLDEKHLWTGGFTHQDVAIWDVIRAEYFPDHEPFTVAEAACAFRLPSPPLAELPGLPIKRSRTSIGLLPCETSPLLKTVTLAVNEHQGMRQIIEMNADDRMRHTFIAGATGTGKSTFMESLVLQDIVAGRGLTVIDPHGEMVDSIIGKIPEGRRDDVIVWDLLDNERPIGFNLLQWKTIAERDIIIDELYMSMHHLYDFKQTGGPIFESNFRGMIKLLMGDKPRKDFIPTIVEFPLCYLESNFRTYLAKGIEDQQILDFVKELERTGGDASLANLSPYITSKFSRFTQDITIKRILGQARTRIDFEQIMNQGKILLLKLGKGRFGSVTSALLASQIVSRFKHAAMKRGEMAPTERRDFFLYVDECHNLPAENFMELLAEARKYRMGLVLSTQYTAQLTQSKFESNDNLLAAILGNVGTLVLFRLGNEDAVKLEQVVLPCFQTRDLIGLPNWCGYMRLQMNNQAVPPFSFKTILDDIPFDSDRAQSLTKLSRLKFGRDCTLVDAEIMGRRSPWVE